MIFLIIFGSILMIVLGLLFVPIVVDLEYTDGFRFKVSFFKITLFNSKKQKKTESKEQTASLKEKQKKSSVLDDAKAYFMSIKSKKGFSGAVKEVMALIGQILSHIKRLMKYINICKVKLDITVGTADAAMTAIEYGAVCSAVYPVTSLLDSLAHIGFKEINVSSDFEGGKCDFGFSGTVKMQIFYLIICAVRIYKTIKNFIGEYKDE